jgi:ABC-2 type transport system ATP-binding protein
MLARLLLIGAIVIGIGAPATNARLAQAGDFTKLDTTVTMSDGVQIAVTYYEPSGTPPAGGWPAVMMFHGLGQTRNSLDLRTWSANRVAETYLAPAGYAVLTFDARAHGQSGGLFSLDGPRELQDTRELFAWLTAHPRVNRDKVGALGVSYGGGMVWLATVAGVPFKAVVTAATWTDLRAALMPQSLLRTGVVLGFLQDIPPSKYTPEVQSVLQDAAIGRTAAVGAFLASRSTRQQLGHISVPALLIQGRRDFAFDADQAIDTYKALRGPKRLYLGDLGHAPAADPPGEVQHFAAEARSWFDQYLKGRHELAEPRIELAADPWRGKTVTYAHLPPTRALRFTSAKAGVLVSQGKLVRTLGTVGHLETFGDAVLRLTVSSRTGFDHIAAVLAAARRDGREIVVSDGGIALPTLGRRARTLAIRFPDDITSIPRGARLRVYLGATSTVQSPANAVYLSPVKDGEAVSVRRLSLTLHVLRKPVSP